MFEPIGESSEPHLRQRDDCVVVEFGYGSAGEVSQIYRALAVYCLQRGVKRVLIKPGDDDPAGERALRDAFTVMVLAGLEPGFRAALVFADARVEAVYGAALRDLQLANVETRSFENEDDALRWLKPARDTAALAG